MLDRIRIPSLGKESEVHVTKSYMHVLSPNMWVWFGWSLQPYQGALGFPTHISRAVMPHTSKLETINISFETL